MGVFRGQAMGVQPFYQPRINGQGHPYFQIYTILVATGYWFLFMDMQ